MSGGDHSHLAGVAERSIGGGDGDHAGSHAGDQAVLVHGGDGVISAAPGNSLIHAEGLYSRFQLGLAIAGAGCIVLAEFHRRGGAGAGQLGGLGNGAQQAQMQHTGLYAAANFNGHLAQVGHSGGVAQLDHHQTVGVGAPLRQGLDGGRCGDVQTVRSEIIGHLRLEGSHVAVGADVYPDETLDVL